MSESPKRICDWCNAVLKPGEGHELFQVLDGGSELVCDKCFADQGPPEDNEAK